MHKLLLFLGSVVILGAGCSSTKPIVVNKNTEEKAPQVKVEEKVNEPVATSTTTTPTAVKTSVKKITLFPNLGIDTSTVTEMSEEGNVLTLKLDDTAKLEIFQVKDVPNRQWGVIDGAVTDQNTPKEFFRVKGFDVWVYFKKDDKATRQKLLNIIDSMVLKIQ